VSSSYVIGTHPSCDIRITDDEFVSARHARVWQDTQGRAWVEDLGSVNGTWLDRLYTGRRVYGPVRVHPGDVLFVGRTKIPWTVPQPG
jgi:pSer/pThr/pTyr-binding forkhead associated (FHA) protein